MNATPADQQTVIAALTAEIQAARAETTEARQARAEALADVARLDAIARAAADRLVAYQTENNRLRALLRGVAQITVHAVETGLIEVEPDPAPDDDQAEPTAP